jgi:glucose/arabinose dehydrogenase
MKRMIIVLFFDIFIIAAFAQKGIPSATASMAVVHARYPQHEDFSTKLISSIKVPEGFEVIVAANGLGKPRMLAYWDAGLYVTRRDQGDVLLLSDPGGNGVFDKLKTVVTEFPDVHGIAIRNGMIYLCSSKILKKGKINSDGSVDSLEVILNDLPDGAQHYNRTIAFGPDGLLYITVGSNCPTLLYPSQKNFLCNWWNVNQYNKSILLYRFQVVRLMKYKV